MSDPRFRVRVERLLRGDFRPGDVKDLLLYARDRCDGRESVQEIGDFIAHHDERNKGIVTRTARGWFAIVRYIGRYTLTSYRDIDIKNLPNFIIDFLKATMIRSTDIDFRDNIGLRRAQAQQYFTILLSKISKKEDGTYLILDTVTPNELKLFWYLCSCLKVHPAFTPDRFFEEFCETLRSNSILNKQEYRQIEQLKVPICLLSACVMHNNNILMNDGSTFRLSAAASDTELSINAAMPLPTLGGYFPVNISCSMYTVECDIRKYIDDSLLKSQNWDCEIEMTNDRRIVQLA